VKPTPSIRKTQETIDVRDGQRVSISVEGRHDLCIALRMPVIVEAVTAIVLADCMLAEQMVSRVWTARPAHPAAGERGEEEAGAPAARALDGLIYDAIAGIPGGVIFDEDTVAKLETVTSRLEHLKHIIRGRDEEELRLFFSRARGSR
jgi:hypothetical protein